jgi:hypothetical protein
MWGSSIAAPTGRVPSAKHLRHPVAIDVGWSLSPKNHSPAFKPITASGAKAANQILTVASGPLADDDPKVVATFGAVSSNVLSHLSPSEHRLGGAIGLPPFA